MLEVVIGTKEKSDLSLHQISRKPEMTNALFSTHISKLFHCDIPLLQNNDFPHFF
jgi:hypothetical protein